MVLVSNPKKLDVHLNFIEVSSLLHLSMSRRHDASAECFRHLSPRWDGVNGADLFALPTSHIQRVSKSAPAAKMRVDTVVICGPQSKI